MKLNTGTLLILLLLAYQSNAQSLDKFKDNVNQCFVIRYYKLDYQLAIEKRIPFDSTKKENYVIGIYLDKYQTSLIDVLMRSGGAMKLENDIKINLLGDVSVYNQGRSMEILAIKHYLSTKEFDYLKNYRIEYFSILGIKKDFDKYQREHIIKAINNLSLETY